MKQTTQFMKLLHFDQEDLAFNRQAKLSDNQRDDLMTRRRRTMWVGGVIMILAVLLATTAIFLGRRNDTSLLTIIGIGVTICNAAIIGIFSRYWLRLSNDINRGEILVLKGKLERVVRPINRRIAMYTVRIDEVEVTVSKDLFKEFQHGARYRLYRTPYTGILLAAEEDKR